ncbi:MAG TPA: SPOR domain-containing protein [Macromonas sp.]|nr:SPOR domain-containing protein [Macromonas sp.]
MFNFRSSSQGRAAPAQPLTVEAVRRRARHRLIGACVLVLAGVIGLPLLFDTQPRPIPVDIPIDIPARTAAKPLAAAEHAPAVRVQGLDEQETVVNAAPVPHEPAQEPPKPALKEAAEPVTVTKEAPRPAAKDVAKTSDQDASKTKDAARAQALLDNKTASADKDRVVVQVGAFAESNRAQEVRNKLERAGLKTYTHVAETAQGKRIRVRIGPFENRAQAEKAAQKVKALGLQAAILTL